MAEELLICLRNAASQNPLAIKQAEERLRQWEVRQSHLRILLRFLKLSFRNCTGTSESEFSIQEISLILPF
jgi:hypothetical protein